MNSILLPKKNSYKDTPYISISNSKSDSSNYQIEQSEISIHTNGSTVNLNPTNKSIMNTNMTCIISSTTSNINQFSFDNFDNPSPTASKVQNGLEISSNSIVFQKDGGFGSPSTLCNYYDVTPNKDDEVKKPKLKQINLSGLTKVSNPEITSRSDEGGDSVISDKRRLLIDKKTPIKYTKSQLKSGEKKVEKCEEVKGRKNLMDTFDKFSGDLDKYASNINLQGKEKEKLKTDIGKELTKDLNIEFSTIGITNQPATPNYNFNLNFRNKSSSKPKKVDKKMSQQLHPQSQGKPQNKTGLLKKRPLSFTKQNNSSSSTSRNTSIINTKKFQPLISAFSSRKFSAKKTQNTGSFSSVSNTVLNIKKGNGRSFNKTHSFSKDVASKTVNTEPIKGKMALTSSKKKTKLTLNNGIHPFPAPKTQRKQPEVTQKSSAEPAKVPFSQRDKLSLLTVKLLNTTSSSRSCSTDQKNQTKRNFSETKKNINHVKIDLDSQRSINVQKKPVTQRSKIINNFANYHKAKNNKTNKIEINLTNYLATQAVFNKLDNLPGDSGEFLNEV